MLFYMVILNSGTLFLHLCLMILFAFCISCYIIVYYLCNTSNCNNELKRNYRFENVRVLTEKIRFTPIFIEFHRVVKT